MDNRDAGTADRRGRGERVSGISSKTRQLAANLLFELKEWLCVLTCQRLPSMSVSSWSCDTWSVARCTEMVASMMEGPRTSLGKMHSESPVDWKVEFHWNESVLQSGFQRRGSNEGKECQWDNL